MNTNKAAALATPQTQTDLNLALSRHLASVPAGTKVTADRSCRGLVAARNRVEGSGASALNFQHSSTSPAIPHCAHGTACGDREI